jgi:NADH:ubiquinone oxidoreductase subunit 6 (subunit J)
MMVALLLVLAGFALMFGAKDLAGKIVKITLGVVVMLAVISCAVRSCRCSMSGLEREWSSTASDAVLAVTLLSALALVGLIAWRRRADHARARELWTRRNGTPRARALPSSPSTGSGEGD